jgi:CTP:molybdopterin cytidylyltransferase MocA
VVDVPVRGSIPLDVDTREDYEAVLAEAARRTPAT